MSLDPLETWKADFGNEYIDRNDYAEWKIADGIEAFRRMTAGTTIKSALEVGSNIGLNLLALRRLLGEHARLYAVEPNRKAFERVRSHAELNLAGAWNCDAFGIPVADASIDLVFTCGVLIHIPPDRLQDATTEIVRVAKRYVLCAEYFSHVPAEIRYRGQEGLLFKRDFGSYYLDLFPTLKCVEYGFLWQRELSRYDNLNWWLFERPSA
jgi:pseudaminic acid biosynthesis-associated methylase